MNDTDVARSMVISVLPLVLHGDTAKDFAKTICELLEMTFNITRDAVDHLIISRFQTKDIEIMDSVELVLESVGNDYPGLVREALTAKEPDSICSASLSSCGYAWLIVGQSLYVWKYDAEDGYACAPAVLNLPPSGLPYNAQTVCVYKRQGFSTSGIIAVTPEGIVRHWSMPDRQFSDSSIDLDREVVLSLTRINLQSSEGICFLLATTTCSLFLLNVNTSIAPTPGKRQRLSSEITVKIIHTNARTGIGGKLASAIFGEGKQSGSRLIRALVYEQSNEEPMSSLSNVSSSLSPVAVSNIHILAVTEDHLFSYSMEDSTKIWSSELTDMASEHFALDLWNLHDIEKHNHWREKIKTWILDAVNIRSGVLILFACINKAVSTQIHFAFGYVSEYDGSQPPIALEWFCILKILSNEYKSSEKKALGKIALRLPADSGQVLHDKVEDILLVTQKAIYSFRLPDRLLKKTPLKLVLCAVYNSTFISSARDARYCYVFLEENGLQRVRLLPRGFDANLAQTVAQMSKMDVHTENLSSVKSDRHELTRAFYLFSRADLHEASDVMHELLTNRHAGIAQICVDYAIDLVDDVPNDERWDAAEHSSYSEVMKNQISSKSSFLLEVHLEEQKKRVLAMFILFIKTIGLEDKLNRTVKTHLCESRSARSQIVELTEKIDIAIGLYKWSKQNRSAIFDAALERILSKRKENISGKREFLTRHDYFFREVSRVQDLFSELVEKEESIVENDKELLDSKLECVKYVGAALITGKKAIDEHRDDVVLDIENDLRWTQEKNILRPFIKHLSILFNHLDQVGRDSPNYTGLLKQGVLISAFVMNEQTFDDRQNSPIIAKFLAISEHAIAVELAKRFRDYKTIIRLACALPDLERKTEIEEYKEFFSSGDFCNILYEYYLENGYIKDLLEMKEPDADMFFATQTNVGWMRNLENGDFAKACHTLKALSRKSNDDVILKRRLLSFAKISALCQDQVDNNFLKSVKCDLSLIKHQQKINSSLEMKFNSSEPTSKIRSYTAEEIIRAHLNNASCDADQCFDALLILSILMDEEASNRTVELVHSLQTKIWIAAVRANSDYWKKLTRDDDSRCSTVYCKLLDRITAYAELSNKRKLELILDAKELAECLTEFAHNKLFVVLLRTSEEAARRNISSRKDTRVS
ncbi:Nuclear pore complex protein [Dirofilaria immitis]